MPITLDVTAMQAKELGLVAGRRVVLRDFRDEAALAILTGALDTSDARLALLVPGPPALRRIRG